jgi:hypothetical protein
LFVSLLAVTKCLNYAPKNNFDLKGLFCCINPMRNEPMIYGYARVSTDGQSVDAQVKQLHEAGAEKVFRETARGAQSNCAGLARALAALDKGDVLMVTRLNRLARSTRDFLNTVEDIIAKKARFRSLEDTWADSTTPHGRLMLAVLSGLAEFERELIAARTGEGRNARIPPARCCDPSMARTLSISGRAFGGQVTTPTGLIVLKRA